MSDEEAPKWVTPLSSFKPGDWRTPTLKDMELPEDRVDDEDYSLVFVPEDSWAKLIHWCSTTKQHLKIGPSMHTTELAERIMGPAMWLNNHNSYIEFKKDRKKFRVEGLLHKYGIGELPAHRQTRLVWDLDVNRMYVPLLVNGNHWISMCANFVTRSLEVFDCGGLKHNKDLEPFAHLIPRIVNDVQSSEKRGFTVKPYDVTYAPMPLFLNKTSSDCGVCALKHIEAHLLGMDLTLVNDDNIREARQKIGYDLWEAANDLELFREWEKLFLQRLQLLLRMVGKKIKKNMTKVRCRNWKGSGKVSYADISSLESQFNKGELFPFISATGNNDVVDRNEFYREDEKKYERISPIEDGDIVEVEDVRDTHVEEPVVVARRGKRKLNDPGAEARKKELLCQRAAEHNSGISNGMKTFIEAHLRFLVLQQQWGKTKTNHHRFCVLQQQGKNARLMRVWVLLRFVGALGKEESYEEAPKWVTPLSSFKLGDWRTPTLKDMELPEDRVIDDDYSLVFVPEDSWAKLLHWCSTTKQHLKIGPSMYTGELAEWDLQTSLRRWNPSKVAFMSCIFSNQMKNSYIDFKKDRKKFKVEGLLHPYGIGELPAHERTTLVWDVDVNRMYVPLLVHGNHWISMCVNFVTRSIEHIEAHLLGIDLTLVNDENIREARQKIAYDLWEAANDPVLISRIGKFIPPKATTSPTSSEKRGFTVKPYDVTYAPMPLSLNKTSSDCGVYALKHIEAHLLGMDLTLVNDDNIREASQKISYDLWEAANDPELISRMGKFIPPKATTSPTVEIL
ncbi:hypothetical protein F2Q68_00020114 [Brassica cretica]|uniref:Ubiquitin-like protease family profile domain-containing protein n=1 Tax=Brassica cretica TaxID=69181 RepID=A0A8S9FTD9_BRACR|nr:hypothetical protein F2Q68_00020114 [Brassica cretica]